MPKEYKSIQIVGYILRKLGISGKKLLKIPYNKKELGELYKYEMLWIFPTDDALSASSPSPTFRHESWKAPHGSSNPSDPMVENPKTRIPTNFTIRRLLKRMNPASVPAAIHITGDSDQ